MNTNVPLVDLSSTEDVILQGKPIKKGSVVVSDFYVTESELRRKVTNLKRWPNSVSVSTDGGAGGRELVDVDLASWIRWPEPKT